MPILRLDPDSVLKVDGVNYHVLLNAVAAIKDVPGLVVEIGTRKGGSAKLIIDALVVDGPVDRTMLCIDPYGDIDYPATNLSMTLQPIPGKEQAYALQGDPSSPNEVITVHHDYTNDMRNEVIPALYAYAFQSGINFQFLQLEDHEYMSRFGDGYPSYGSQGKRLESEYAFVFFDGPHTNDFVMSEIEFFIPRAAVGAAYVFDDVWMYDHEPADKMLREAGFEEIERALVPDTPLVSKIAYVKRR